MVRPMVNSVKHYVQFSLETITASAAEDKIVAFAKEVADDANECRIGASIKAIYLEFWVRTQSTSPASVLMTFYKGTSGVAAMTAIEQAALHDYDNKKNIFYHTQGLTNDQDADAIAFFRGWIKIPKGKQRMALGDVLRVSVFAQGAVDLTLCGFATYKEYF